ncbi:MAG: hypothetical protein H7333_09935 [Bdellovibrionales bacterium]|nr:hypothetical protein [Oligoflexia bacterium]
MTLNDYRPPSTCDSTENSKCRAETELASKKQLAGNTSEDQKESKLTYLNPIASEGNKPNFKFPDPDCGNISDMSGGYGSSATPMPPNLIAYDATQQKNAQKDFKKIETQIENIRRKMGKPSDPGNPYSLPNVSSGLSELSSCINNQIAKMRACNISIPDVEKLLSELEIKKNPSLDEFTKIKEKFNSLSVSVSQTIPSSRSSETAPWAATQDEINSVTKATTSDALKKCVVILEKKAINASFFTQRLDSLMQVPDDAWTTNESAKFAAANLIKLCSANLDLFWGEKLDVSDQKNKSLCTARYGDMVPSKYASTIKKDIARKYFKTGQIQSAIRSDIDRVMPGTTLNRAPMQRMNQPADTGNYCPNRTAEFIENLLEAHPCISHVYVPDAWLVSRLNALGKKIIFRPFEKDDVFAMDYSEVKCK